MKKVISLSTVLLAFVFIMNGCGSKKAFKLDYEKYKLENGLEVVLHEDKSDPIVSVAIQYHVGSNREIKGRTGFAHLFEHILFQESQHIPQDQFFKKIQNAGGTLNGGTWDDGTIYYEVVPKNALEMVLWMESDRMGFLLSTVTQEAFENQQSVVKNEKRQRVDNNPYGHTEYVKKKLLYPENHPYNWTVIGEMQDLQNATLKDVRDFYQQWYGPNNATMVIAGDFDKVNVKQLVEKYFGEIKASDPVTPLATQPVSLSEIKRAYHEDDYAKSPELNMVFPSAEQYSKDAYALDFLGMLLGGTKKAPLYKTIVEDKKLAPSVSSYQSSNEIAGEFIVRIRTFPNINLNDVENAVKESFAQFAEETFSVEDLERLKVGQETNFYNGIASILNKSFQLSFYNTFKGSPGYITQDLENTLAVTKEDVIAVYNKYIKDKNYVLTSFVPKGQVDLVVANSEKAVVKIESLGDQDVASSGEIADVKVEKIPSSFDRSVEPGKGEDPLLNIPILWQTKLANNIKVYGIEHNELPLVQFSLTINGGLLFDDLDKVGVANLVSDIMMEGTKNKTPIELEEAIDELGASINMGTGDEGISISANCLASKFEDTFNLVQEILFEPRWDEKEFDRLKNETIERINRNLANPNAIAGHVFARLVYGEDHILGRSTLGTQESVKAITIDDVKNYYASYFSPNLARISIVGAVAEKQAVSVFKSLEEKWPDKNVELPKHPLPAETKKAKVYFVDYPNAKQSAIRIGNLGLSYTDSDYYPTSVMNYKLGGSFNGIVNLILREEKGYTYGARTGFSGSMYPGTFTASSSVQSSATLESVQIFKDEMEKYRNGISQEDIDFTKNSLIKSNSRRFETLGALRGMVEAIAKYGLPVDYIKTQEDFVRALTIENHKKLAEKYIHPDNMVYLVVGDAETQLKSLSKLGFGKPILLDKTGNIIG